ncbi:MAG TPA: hypothetical protein VFE47_18495 [Tepidisphaeraceae bacterium]|nr:hypothetical protein [Tepidisphaeraceae bacterium]
MGTDPHALLPQAFKFVRRRDVERSKMPVGQKIDELSQAVIRLDLIVGTARAVHDPEPSTALLFN